MSACILVVTATHSAEEADRIGSEVVAQRLAASAQRIGPMRSTYWWKDGQKQVDEWQCVIRTTRERYGELEREVLRLHSYELPGIVAIPIVAGYSN
mgnify:CR=1 FL=1